MSWKTSLLPNIGTDNSNAPLAKAKRVRNPAKLRAPMGITDCSTAKLSK